MRVYKYKLDIRPSGVAEVSLPLGAQLLHVDHLYRDFHLWALVEDGCTRIETRRLLVVGTGHEVTEPNVRHLNTVMVEGGRLVFHAFEVLA